MQIARFHSATILARQGCKNGDKADQLGRCAQLRPFSYRTSDSCEASFPAHRIQVDPLDRVNARVTWQISDRLPFNTKSIRWLTALCRMNNRQPEQSVMREGWPTVEAPITELLTRPLRAPPGGKNSSDEALHPAPQRFRLQTCVRRPLPACQPVRASTRRKIRFKLPRTMKMTKSNVYLSGSAKHTIFSQVYYLLG